jgi:hypothetical protein
VDNDGYLISFGLLHLQIQRIDLKMLTLKSKS